MGMHAQNFDWMYASTILHVHIRRDIILPYWRDGGTIGIHVFVSLYGKSYQSGADMI